MKEMLLARASELKAKGITPTLAVIRVGKREDDMVYERSILRRFNALGLNVNVHELAEDITQSEFDAEFMRINNNPEVHGILLFRPLPAGLSDEYVCLHMNPDKDVDGMSPVNAARIFAGEREGFAPCTPSAVMVMLAQYGYDVAGANVVIVGRSMVVGRPLAMLMLRANATVTVCHSKTHNLPDICKKADIVIAAAGHAKLLTQEYFTKKSVVVDVGIDIDENGNLCGDVDFERVEKFVKAISPVPGGVGAVTTSVVAEHVIMAARLGA